MNNWFDFMRSSEKFLNALGSVGLLTSFFNSTPAMTLWGFLENEHLNLNLALMGLYDFTFMCLE